jgi:NADH-quinone oxidoreductase subunit C
MTETTGPGADALDPAGETPSDPPIEPTGTGGTRHDMFGASGFGDTSGFGGLVVRPPQLVSTPKPYGGWFDDATGALEAAYPAFSDAIERVVVHRGELTLYVKREALLELARTLRDDPQLRFEMCASVSGVDYPDDPTGRRLHSVYHLLSMTYRRRLRLEVSVSFEDPHVPSLTEIYPTANWQERETWDFFGIVYDGHPALTRIEMPDDWPGHPQRKDYPLGGVPVEYKGATVPPPDERRSYA